MREREEDEKRKEGEGVCVRFLAVIHTRDKEIQTSAYRRTCFHDDDGKHGGCGGYADHADQTEEAVQG